MNIQGLYAAAAVTDMERAEAFYTALLGRGPDDRPMDGLIQWRPFDNAGIQLFADTDNAGHSSITIVAPDMAAARRELSSNGLDLGDDVQGDFGVIAQISDPDGNRITLAEPPREMP
ncbi:VOC family protein [Ilumatobacter nonamiensis]|uniref:VOC family protein n=1 Tax=Ilumatobacter nonamiensis TaxID=467093 RepID=UPI00034863B5|nr:lactoylglutathione lyase [Ilumatobacter nonamiensis]